MDYYLESLDSALKSLKSSETGLTHEEAKKRLAENGKNKLAEAEKEPLIKRFFQQMLDPMVIILLVAAVISAVLSIAEKGFPIDVVIILTVVIINSVLGVYQENKAEKALEALQEMSAATSKVLRGGDIVNIKSEDLVVGDVVLLDAGDAVPADCRILECVSMTVEEAALTGESVPVNKIIDALNGGEKDSIPLGDRKNMLYMGSTIAYGRGKAVVTATGMKTEMGKIADAIANAEEGETPLQLKLKQLSRYLTWIVVGVCVFIFFFRIVMAFINKEPLDIQHILDFFMIAVALAVAAIPEGLVAVITLVLSIGVTNMAKKNAIIRKLTAVETLGCAQIICSDKTGTLTQNKMTVTDRFAQNEDKLANAMALCTDVRHDAKGAMLGDPTEIALVNYAAGLGFDKWKLGEAMPRVGEAPFDSSRKMMSTIHKSEKGYIQFTKGAPDEILKRCTKAEIDGKTVELTDAVTEKILSENKRMADKALRILAAACRSYSEMPGSNEPADLEQGLTFIGLAGMIDPVRPEVKAAIEECRQAGITPIMITGDHLDTAIAIARELDILEDVSHAITGAELEKIPEKEFFEKVTGYSVYARVQPEHKSLIVRAWRAHGMVTAMTGDGVNDAPSIKNADIGVGMGITGTDVTKNVADMVLADDNFASIVSAVGEGRRIYDNMRKAIQFLLGSNLSEVLSIFIATMMNFTILKTAHLLWINLVTDCLPALALGYEKAESDIMYRRPRSAKAGIFADGLGIDALYQGLIVTVLTVFSFYVGEFLQNGAWHFRNISEMDGAEGMTMAFLTMSMCEIFHSFNMRSQRGSAIGMMLKGSHNKLLYISTAAALAMTTIIVTIEPVALLFSFTPIDMEEYVIAIILSIVVIPIVEVVKFFQRRFSKAGG